MTEEAARCPEWAGQPVPDTILAFRFHAIVRASIIRRQTTEIHLDRVVKLESQLIQIRIAIEITHHDAFHNTNVHATTTKTTMLHYT